MTIRSITQEELEYLIKIQKEYPNLTYQNKGYDYPDKSKWSENDKLIHEGCSNLFKKHIIGFQEFNHFLLGKDNNIRIRFQYDWGADTPPTERRIAFTGVGYLYLNELIFDKTDNNG